MTQKSYRTDAIRSSTALGLATRSPVTGILRAISTVVFIEPDVRLPEIVRNRRSQRRPSVQEALYNDMKQVGSDMRRSIKHELAGE